MQVANRTTRVAPKLNMGKRRGRVRKRDSLTFDMNVVKVIAGTVSPTASFVMAIRQGDVVGSGMLCALISTSSFHIVEPH